MRTIEIDLNEEGIEKVIPEQNIRVKSFYRDLFGNPVKEPEKTNPKKMQELALITVLKPRHIPEPHSHRPRYSPKNIRSYHPIPQVITRFYGREITFGPPPKGLGRYEGVEEIYYPKCNADLWIFYGNSKKKKRIELIQEGPLQGIHNINNATAIVRLNNRPVVYLAWFWPALGSREMIYPSNLRKELVKYYQRKWKKPII